MDIDELLNEEINEEPAVYADSNEEKWYDNGLKRITGESIYWSTVKEPNADGYIEVDKLGTVLRLPFIKEQSISTEHTIHFGINEQLSFIVKSGTKLNFRLSDVSLSTGSFTYYDNPVYTMTAYEVQHSGGGDSHTVNRPEAINGWEFNTYIQKQEEYEFLPEINIFKSWKYGQLRCPWVFEMTIPSAEFFYKHTYWVRSGNL
ncbi:MAG: hypothetical protein HUJ76_11265, partial [Parasporobacterium sp.]|nr:hypothetical protein [Parasporobacterium sp.]